MSSLNESFQLPIPISKECTDINSLEPTTINSDNKDKMVCELFSERVFVPIEKSLSK